MNRIGLVYAACVVSFVLGLCFIFVWTPQPWGGLGFDHYQDIARELARGRPFSTIDVPWGYAYFLAAFYRLFGERTWIPLVAQAALNACVPLLVFAFARTWLDRPTAIVAAALTGILSFNTVYASTQSSDAVCTVLFMAAVVGFSRALATGRLGWFALVGVLSGLAPQFRPNLILLPFVFAGFAFARRPSASRLVRGSVIVLAAAGVLSPWVVRNYRLTGAVLPTSVHGGVQLWYGSLQVGPYLRSWAYNPRSAFESAAFAYTSLDDATLIVDARTKSCAEGRPSAARLTYWSDRDPHPRQVDAARIDGQRFEFEIPPPHDDVVLYYYLVAEWASTPGGGVQTTPGGGARDPFVYFVSQDHLGDLDAHGDLLDFFDVVRLARHEAWGEAVPFADRLRGAGVVDVRSAVDALLRRFARQEGDVSGRPSAVVTDAGASAVVRLADGATISIPRAWRGRISDLTLHGELARSLMSASVRLRSLTPDGGADDPRDRRCVQFEEVHVNDVFYRREPHQMRRYLALAFDNIRHDPAGFVLASVYRAVRLFVIQGNADRQTSQQFAGSGAIYAAATIASVTYLLLFAGGIVAAWRRGADVALPLVLIAYIPLTLAPVLTNMRYSVTVQPLIFMFIAAALTAIAARVRERRTAAGSAREEVRTGRPL